MAGVYGGLQPWGWVRHATLFSISASEGSNLFKGDPIAADVTGCATLWATGAQFLGSALAFFDSAMNPINYYNYVTYSVVCYVLVADDPDQEFCIAEDSVTTPLTQLLVFGNIDPVATNAGDSTLGTGLSGWQLDSNTVAATATLVLKVMKLAPIVGNTLYNATTCPNPKWIVVPNLAWRRDTTGITT